MFEDVGFQPDLIFTTIHGSKNDQLIPRGNFSTNPGTISASITISPQYGTQAASFSLWMIE